MASRPPARSPLRRLLGLETEYAIRFAPAGEHPGNDVIFGALSRAIARLVETRPGSSAQGRDQFFTANGGAFYYEFLPHCQQGGLIEGSTPECRGPGQALLYQRAQESLLLQALPAAAAELGARGYPGELGLLKNSRDARGNVYGGQENYEVELAHGFGLLLYRLGLALLVPVLAVQMLMTYVCVALFLVGAVVGSVVALVVPRWRRRLANLAEGDERAIENALGRFHLWLILVCTWPVTTPFALLLRALAFRRARRQLLAFLVSRPIVAGAGWVTPERSFALAEKSAAVRSVLRFSILPGDRPIFDTGNLIKMLCAPFNLQLRPVGQLFARRQRLQLGCGDSNRAQVAEYLKVGTTALMLDMIEDGFLTDAPRLRRPVAALARIVADPTLAATVEVRGGEVRGGEPQTALELQRFYLERAREYLRAHPAPSLEAREVVRLWGEVLDTLAAGDYGALVGRLDWITKRFLLERCGGDGGDGGGGGGGGRDDVLKTLDLRYHELGVGYYDRLERGGEAVRLVDRGAARRAVHEPPDDTPAFFRGQLIQRQAGVDVPLLISWDSATLGSRLGGKVIPFRRRAGRDGEGGEPLSPA